MAKYGPTLIRQRRQEAGLTLEELAEKVGTSHATLSRIERGVVPYGQSLLEKLAHALHIPVASLLTRNATTDADAFWGVWQEVKPEDRVRLLELAKTFVKTGR